MGVISADDIDGAVRGEKKVLVAEELAVRRDGMRVEKAVCGDSGEPHSAAGLEYFQRALQYCLKDRLLLDPKEHPVLFSESNLRPRAPRMELTELLFEELQVPSLYLVKSAVLAWYDLRSFSAGRSTALVVDSGAYTSYAVPVSDGLALNKSITKCDLGGETLTDLILADLETHKQVSVRPRYCVRKSARCYVDKAGELQIDPHIKTVHLDFPRTHESYRRFAVREVVRDLKENVFKVADTPYSEGSYRNVPGVLYELPDGQEVEIGEERFGLTETLLTGSPSFSGLPDLAHLSISFCDTDLRKELYANVLLAGGNTLFPGFADRLTKRLSDLTTPTMKVKSVAAPPTVEKRFGTWLGGSVLASLSSFSSLWMTRKEYAEHGAILVDRKCP